MTLAAQLSKQSEAEPDGALVAHESQQNEDFGPGNLHRRLSRFVMRRSSSAEYGNPSTS